MIYEFRTYRLKPRSLPEVLKRFGDAYEARKKYSPLTGFFYTEIGLLNEILHIWAYADLGERGRIRAEASKDPNWPPKTSEFIVGMHVDILTPFPFSPPIKPGKMGPVYEMRSYLVPAGSGLMDTQKRWEPAVPERTKRSPLLLAGGCDLGTPNKFIHIWPYASMDARMEIRTKAVADGVWPPKGGGELIAQENKIMLPSAFSPLQ